MITKFYILMRRGNFYGPFLDKESAKIAQTIKMNKDLQYPEETGKIEILRRDDYLKLKKVLEKNPYLDYKKAREFNKQIRTIKLREQTKNNFKNQDKQKLAICCGDYSIFLKATTAQLKEYSFSIVYNDNRNIDIKFDFTRQELKALAELINEFLKRNK